MSNLVQQTEQTAQSASGEDLKMSTTLPKIALGAWSWGAGAAGGDQVFGNHLFPRATSQVAACRHLATAARVKYPAALQRCKFDTPLLAAGSLIGWGKWGKGFRDSTAVLRVRI